MRGCCDRLQCTLGTRHTDRAGMQFKVVFSCSPNQCQCYDIKPVRKEEGKSYWKIPLCDDDATREK